jgi:hypothetical protein
LCQKNNSNILKKLKKKKKKMKIVITYADGLAVGLACCADVISMPTVFLAMPTIA